MPLRSKKQARFLAANKPEVFEELIKKTPSIKNLPEKVKKDKEKMATRINRLIGGQE